jgi:hypothetical protein
MGILGQDWTSRIIGSAFADASANTITAPEGQDIIAIQFLAITELSALVAKDANRWINIGAAAHDRGHQTIQVNGTVSTSATIAWDVTTASLGLKVGDEVYLTATGVLLGTIVTLGASNIVISATTSITDDHYVSILSPGKSGGELEGTGGMAVDASNRTDFMKAYGTDNVNIQTGEIAYAPEPQENGEVNS